jgi:ACT domain-containing protein
MTSLQARPIWNENPFASLKCTLKQSMLGQLQESLPSVGGHGDNIVSVIHHHIRGWKESAQYLLRQKKWWTNRNEQKKNVTRQRTSRANSTLTCRCSVGSSIFSK